MEKLFITAENAEKIASWLKDREGIAVWKSIDLSNPSRQMITPVKDNDGNSYTKPHWSMSNTPIVYTDINDITVSFDKEVKRFHVAVRMGAQGFSLKVTDAGSAKIRNEVEKAGEKAYYIFDYSNYKNAVIIAPEKEMSLTDYINRTEK